jgi:nitroimidazol reductase NimA-like FMN-containing flavoprotein (pyridoxamine 5'-phosphate oxidase superfamily)
MRRKDREVQERELIEEIIRGCQVCRLGLAKDNAPYIVPVSFGYDGKALYFHSARQGGKKVDYIAANRAVCFEFERGVQLIPDESGPCNWTFHYQTVIGYGRVEELAGQEEKTEGLRQIVAQYSDRAWEFGDEALRTVRVWKIDIEEMTAKQSGGKPSDAG